MFVRLFGFSIGAQVSQSNPTILLLESHFSFLSLSLSLSTKSLQSVPKDNIYEPHIFLIIL